MRIDNVAKCYIDSKHFATYNVGMPSEDIQTNLRIPSDLKLRLQRAADASKRSLTAEVIARLEDSFSMTPAPAVDEHTLDLFAEKVGQVLDERDKKRGKR
jgi:Arc-like DNA binding domain